MLVGHVDNYLLADFTVFVICKTACCLSAYAICLLICESGIEKRGQRLSIATIHSYCTQQTCSVLPKINNTRFNSINKALAIEHRIVLEISANELPCIVRNHHVHICRNQFLEQVDCNFGVDIVAGRGTIHQGQQNIGF